MLGQLRQFWTNLSPIAKWIYGATAVVLLAVVGGVGFWSTQTDYAVLVSGLKAEDAGEITKKLDADRVSYKLTNDGTTILVPTEKKLKTRMNLAVAGIIPGKGKGYELFDTLPMGTTPFVQNINLTRALETELTRTILEMDPVAQARVHIAQTEETPFAREQKPVTASIAVRTKQGMVLSRPAVEGIVKIVAGSVKGLSPENVTVVDMEGRVLSEKRDPRGNMASNDQLAYQREVEARYVENAQEILAGLLGPGRAVVRVTADMSFRHLKEFSEKFDPDGQVAVHELENSSKSTIPPGPRGPVGAVSNLAPPPAAPGQPPVVVPMRDDKTSETEYAVSRVNLEKEEQQGVIDRLTVAVMLIPPKGAGDNIEESLGVSQDDIRELIKPAVGFKEARGDQIKVVIGKAPVDPAPEEVAIADNTPVALPPFLFGQDYMSVVKGTSLGIAALVAIAIAVKSLRRRPAPAPTPAPAFATASSAVPDELNDLHAVAATIKAWLEEPAVVRFEQPAPVPSMPQTKPA